MPDLETLRSEDKALAEMFTADKETLSPEDAQAYRELIDGQVSSHKESHAEVRDESEGASTITVKSVGNAALHNPNATNGLAVHSESWRTEEK
jgi:hypothetical protein